MKRSKNTNLSVLGKLLVEVRARRVSTGEALGMIAWELNQEKRALTSRCEQLERELAEVTERANQIMRAHSGGQGVLEADRAHTDAATKHFC